MSKKKDTPTPVMFFNTPRQPTDIDLVFITSKTLHDNVSENAAKIFLSDYMIKSVVDLNPLSQRIIINRYFYDLLLKYRACADVKVILPLTMLVEDGTHNDWLRLFKDVVCVFIKNNKVFDKVYVKSA